MQPLWLILALLATGCEQVERGLESVLAEQATPTLVATPTQAAPTLVAPPTATAEAAPPGPTALVVWMPPFLAPSADTPGGQALLEQITAFDEAHPDIPVEFYIKAVRGPGSAIAYLHSAPPVAPGVLPDLVLLNRESLIEAAEGRLIVPISELLDPAILADLYPVAVDLGIVDGELIGLPYVLEVQHAVFHEALFEEPPTSFEAILSSPVPYLFPAAPQDSVNHTTLLQYMAAGGRLVDENGDPTLDEGALRAVLTFYAAAHQAGVIDPALFQIMEPAETWASYRDGLAGLATVTSTLYLAERARVRSTTGLIPIPTPDGQPYALATGWCWAVVTRNPERQAASMALVNTLMNPVNQGVFSQASGWLPSQRAALAVWGDNDRYTAFGNTLLNQAQPMPDEALLSVVGPSIQAAVEDVLLNNMLPIQAANEAAQRVNPAPAGSP